MGAWRRPWDAGLRYASRPHPIAHLDYSIPTVIIFIMANEEINHILSRARLAANRRNAQKSTGPRTAAGKRRVALNPRKHDLISGELERQLVARGEDPREFRRLHRDLIAIFRPDEPAEFRVVLMMALVWWEKARRIRNWVSSGPARVDDFDKRLEDWLGFLVSIQRQRHEWWQHRLVAVLGRPLGGPADVRRKIEARLFLFGAKPGRRKYPRATAKEMEFEEFMKAVEPVLAKMQAEAMSGKKVQGPLDSMIGHDREEAEGRLVVDDGKSGQQSAIGADNVSTP
jgi:hypothetical protein